MSAQLYHHHHHHQHQHQHHQHPHHRHGHYHIGPRDGDSFAEGETEPTEVALAAAKAKAAKVDLVSDTNLSSTVKDTAEKYSALMAQHDAVAAELHAEVDSFLGLDWKTIKNKAIPFASRIGIVKKAADKVLGVVKKIDPILNGINEVKGTLQSVSGDSLVETNVPASAKKENDEVHTTLKHVENKVENLEASWKKVATDTKDLEKYTTGAKAAPAPAEEDAFWGALAGGAIKLLGGLFG